MPATIRVPIEAWAGMSGLVCSAEYGLEPSETRVLHTAGLDALGRWCCRRRFSTKEDDLRFL